IVGQAQSRPFAGEIRRDPAAEDAGGARQHDFLAGKFHRSHLVRERGSIRSRSQSPSRLTESTSRNNAAPGKATIQGARSRYSRPTLMIDPQLGSGGRMPRPRNESPASNRIIRPNSAVATTIIGPAM